MQPTAIGTKQPVAAGGSGWAILAVAAVTATLTGPGQTVGVSVFIDHFVDDLALSRSTVSVAYMIGTLAGAAAMPYAGRMIDRWGVRLAQVVVGAAFALALINMAGVNGLLWLVVGFTGIRLLGQGSLSMVSTVTVSLAFERKRGLALGLLATFATAGMAVVPLVLNVVIDAVGWRTAWLVAAAVVAAVVPTIGWFGLRAVPRPGSTTGPIDTAAPTVDGRQSVTRDAAIRTRSFWILAAVAATAGMMTTALNFHQIDLLGEAGFSSTAAAALFLPQVVGSTAAGLGVGMVRDRVGTRYLPAFGAVLMTFALLVAAFVGPGPSVVLYAVSLGAAGGTIHTATATLLADWFGTGHLGSIQGSLTLFNVAGSALGPVALAVAVSLLGGYRPAILVLAVLPALVSAFALGSGTDLRSSHRVG